jgi:hypothetical protein
MPIERTEACGGNEVIIIHDDGCVRLECPDMSLELIRQHTQVCCSSASEAPKLCGLAMEKLLAQVESGPSMAYGYEVLVSREDGSVSVAFTRQYQAEDA